MNKINYKIFRIPFIAIFIIWFVFWLELKTGLDFSRFGLYPRDISSLFWVVFFAIVFSGLFTWLIGRPSYHIGASGLIYALVSFIFFKGIFTRNFQLSALSFIVVFLYGSMIWYIFPDMKEGMSWEGHLGGFISGILLALV